VKKIEMTEAIILLRRFKMMLTKAGTGLPAKSVRYSHMWCLGLLIALPRCYVDPSSGHDLRLQLSVSMTLQSAAGGLVNQQGDKYG
jgi:hypothetical protein